MDFYTRSVYAAVARLQNPDIISPIDDELYLMQSEVCVDHLLDKHDNCWAEVCWKAQNPEIDLVDTNMIGYTQNQANILKEFLKKHTKLLLKQSLITTIRTSINEAFNRVKLNYTDKKVDFAKSFSARHGLAVLHNNNDLLEMLKVIRQAGNLPEFSEQDQINIEKIWKQRESKRKYNVVEINKKMLLESKKLQKHKNKWKNLISQRLNNYRELQQESIESFLKGQDTLTILPTGVGKTLIFSVASILSKALTVVFIPLKTIMEFQLHELVGMGIPAAAIFAALDQFLEVQEKIFGEIAARITKVLWTTSEKFVNSSRFRHFLHNVYKTRGIQFVIDESHCVLEFGQFRPAWAELGQVKNKFPSAPILLLTATCSYQGASELATILQRPNLKKAIIKAVYENLKQISEGRAIIYSSTPDKCIEIFNDLKECIDPKRLDIYHGKMHSVDQKMTIQVGRAGRDGQLAKSVVLYSCADIRRLLMIVNGKIESANEPNIDAEISEFISFEIKRHYAHLNRSKQNIFAMAYTFEDLYQCCWKMAYEPFRWIEDSEISEYGICDNCERRIAKEVVWCDIRRDLLQILDTVNRLIEFANNLTTRLVNFGYEDIADVFMKADNKNTREKNLTSLWVNRNKDDMEDDTEESFINTKNACLHAIDRLCVEGLLVQKVAIKPLRPDSSTFVYTSSISEIAAGARQKIAENSWLE
ncbi:4137_t:CDS:2, partial [Ambispora gerdemannii]